MIRLDSNTPSNNPMPDHYWQDCDICKGAGVFEHDTCRACMGEGGRWLPLPQNSNEIDTENQNDVESE